MPRGPNQHTAHRRLCCECEPTATAPRPAPHPGPRCATHHRAEKHRASLLAHGRKLITQYTMTAEQYWALYRAQGGRCALCQRATGKTKRLAVDHDHKCCPGRTSCGACVRGLLCGPCNQTLGHGRDDAQYFLRAAQYLTDSDLRRSRRVL